MLLEIALCRYVSVILYTTVYDCPLLKPPGRTRINLFGLFSTDDPGCKLVSSWHAQSPAALCLLCLIRATYNTKPTPYSCESTSDLYGRDFVRLTYDVWARSDFVMLLVPNDAVREEDTEGEEGELDACELPNRICSLQLCTPV